MTLPASRPGYYGCCHLCCGVTVRTLFVSGLPLDIKPRELYLLFRPFKGYEGSLIKLTSKQPVGFVSFDSRSEAEAAKNALNGPVHEFMNLERNCGP
ncbi:RNA-binding protein with multiple splicing [Myotis brandtii]|uniref:RNA-binding protein with multiple splicing n=1 Tax=Myotis brandtii TaxID=109478 RepID=S7P8B2_MYOBR|nr:RNA-binding protein with multiple splicing [Myotis brandtii]